MPLTPEILIGTRFRYAPYKGAPSWDFYVEGFQHRFIFGGNSTTTLTLSRGLPTSVYQDVTVLSAIHTGDATRTGSSYTRGLPAGTGPALQIVNTPPQLSAMAGNLAEIFVTPQPTGY